MSHATFQGILKLKTLCIVCLKFLCNWAPCTWSGNYKLQQVTGNSLPDPQP